MSKVIFEKPALDLDGQIDLLIARGLIVPCRETSKQYLKFIGYYRLAGYCIPFQLEEKPSQEIRQHQFKTGTNFENILDHYTFDRKLRVLIIDAIERVEVAIRTTISNVMCMRYGPHWFLDQSLFRIDEYFSHERFLETLEKHLKNSRNLPFIQHYFTKYSSPAYPPSWMIIEILPFGSISMLYQKLAHQSDRKEIAAIFGVNPRIFASWVHAIAYLRNLCAHHARVWNKTFTITPEIVKEHERFLKHNNKFYAQAVIINTFLKIISPDSHWPERLKELFDEYPSIPIQAMGFPQDWHAHEFWRPRALSH